MAAAARPACGVTAPRVPERCSQRGLAQTALSKAFSAPLAAAAHLPYKYLPNLFNRQLDYNQISCIEDGAFRALRDLEVL